MRALVFHGAHDVRVDTVPDPAIQHPRDAILRVTATAICGSDLHMYNGFFPQPRPMVLGHEFMGVVEEVGSQVTSLKRGDRVVVPFPIACGQCWFCEQAAHAMRDVEPEELWARGRAAQAEGRRALRLHGSVRRVQRRAGAVRPRAVR